MSAPGITRAMVLAAGLGQRMRPLTLHTPKPLLVVRGRTLLDHALDHLCAAGVTRVVVNTHWLGEKIAQHVKARAVPHIILQPEPELLDTGGSVRRALPHLGPAPFFVLAGDMPFADAPGAAPALERLARGFDPDHMDALLLLKPRGQVPGLGGVGDFDLLPGRRLARAGRPRPLSHHYISVQIVHPRIFDGTPEGAFSFNLLWDGAERAGRLYGLEHHGACHHVSTPDDLAAANAG